MATIMSAGHDHGASNANEKSLWIALALTAGFLVAESVEGEERLAEIPDRNRVFLDEDAANELASTDAALRHVGVCRLKGFAGFHRVYELRWQEA